MATPDRPPLLKRWATDGTVYLIAGTVVHSFINYVYQLFGARSLGEIEFAPVASLLALSFLMFAVVLLPIEQLVIRAVTFRGGFDRNPRPTIRVAVAGTAVIAVLIAFVGRDRLFAGQNLFIVLVLASVMTHSLYVVGRGQLAGNRRFAAYGGATAGNAMLRLAVAIGLVAIVPSALGVGAALAVGPLIIFVWAASVRLPGEETAHSDESPSRFLASFVLAAAASQVLLLAGPLVAGAMGAAAAEISIIYVTLTIVRAPLVLSGSLVARVLPPLTNLATLGLDAELNRWVVRFAVGGVVIAIPTGILATAIGPDIVALLFGEGFRPTPVFVGLAAAGIVIAGAAMFVGQVLVARGDTTRLAVGWGFALVVAIIALAGSNAEIAVRLGFAFLVGELAALASTAVLSYRVPKSPDSEGDGEPEGA
jgi:O-antigen/teichoic acid export membrane protein